MFFLFRIESLGATLDNSVFQSCDGKKRFPPAAFNDAQIFVPTDRFGGVTNIEYLNGYAPNPDKERFTTRIATVEEIQRFDELRGFGEGDVTVVEAYREFKRLAKNRLESGFAASPGVAGNALILRTRTHLYRIEE